MKLYALALMMSLLLFAAPSSAEEFDPFEVPKEYFSKRVHTIALAPTSIPVGEQADDVRRRIEAAISAALEARGYEVLPSATYASEWVGMSEKLGGVFDPVTGATKPDIWDTAYEYTSRTLRKRHGANAVAYTDVIVAPLAIWQQVTGLNAEYRAANDETLTWKGLPIGVHVYNQPQLVLGTYLRLMIRDLNGTQMYGVRFPIEITAVYVGSGREEKAAAQLFKNEAWIKKAVDGVVGYLPSPIRK